MFARDLSEDRFCTTCGRKLVLVTELSKERDSNTGQRKVERWLQCPKYPRNGLVYLFRGNHCSLSVEHRLLARVYR